MLYKKINIDNFIKIQDEILESVQAHINSNVRFWDKTFSQIKVISPTLYNFLNLHKKLPIRFCRFYLTPANDSLGPHIDGDFKSKSPLGLNLPIIGCEGTVMNWYETQDGNLDSGRYGFGNMNAIVVKDKAKLILLDSVVIDKPTFVRTDVLHEIINSKPSPRLVLSIRFLFTNTIGQHFTDVFNFS